MADIATEIRDLSSRIQTAYDVCEDKGATMPSVRDTYHLSTCIESIEGGGGGSESTMENYGIEISSLMEKKRIAGGETIYGVSLSPYVEMHLSSIDGNPVDATINGLFAYNENIQSCDIHLTDTNAPLYGILQAKAAFISCENLKSVNIYFNETGSSKGFDFYSSPYICQNSKSLKSFRIIKSNPDMWLRAGLNSLAYAFSNCNALTDVELPFTDFTSNYSMRYAFNSCTSLKNIEFTELTAMGTGSTNYEMQYCFQGCTALSSITFNKMNTIKIHLFKYMCSSAGGNNVEVHFPAATTLTKTSSAANSSFYSCSSMKKVYFNSFTNFSGSGNYIFSSCTNLAEIHFPAAAESVVTADSGYSSKWGASSATVYFDL